MASVEFSRKDGRCHLVVDGIELSGVVCGMTIDVQGAEVPELSLDIVALGMNEVAMDEAAVSIRGVQMPASVELALYRHLHEKHGHREDCVVVTTLADKNERFAIRRE